MLQFRNRGSKSRVPKIKTVVFIILISSLTEANQVIRCSDGDTCTVKTKGDTIKVRLSGIDAPENGQDGAREAKQFLEKLIKGKKVELNCSGESYGRKTCDIFIGKINVQQEMVKEGWALDYPKYSGRKYKEDQHNAKKSKKGIWRNTKLTSPHCYRYTGTKECNSNPIYQP